MKFKNVTKRDIFIIYEGKKVVVKPQETIEGEKAILKQYKGLMQINAVPPDINTPRTINSKYGNPFVKKGRLAIPQNEAPAKIFIPEIIFNSQGIVIETIIIEDI